MARRKKEPSIRIDGGKRIDLADKRAKRKVQRENARPIENTRVSDMWARADAKAISKAKDRREIEAIKSLPSRIETVDQYVDNPNWRPEREGEKAFPRKVQMPVNVRESAIATLAHKGAINPAQAAAADRFRAYWEATGSGARAIDFTREAVDGGRGPQDITDRQMSAGLELKACRALLGEHGYNLVRMCAGERMSFHDFCTTRRERETAADMLRIHLTSLAERWGFSMKKQVVRGKIESRLVLSKIT